MFAGLIRPPGRMFDTPVPQGQWQLIDDPAGVKEQLEWNAAATCGPRRSFWHRKSPGARLWTGGWHPGRSSESRPCRGCCHPTHTAERQTQQVLVTANLTNERPLCLCMWPWTHLREQSPQFQVHDVVWVELLQSSVVVLSEHGSVGDQAPKGLEGLLEISPYHILTGIHPFWVVVGEDGQVTHDAVGEWHLRLDSTPTFLYLYFHCTF